jgi:LysR family transcriptional regulator, hydrogen peroxide-inducible genes activator
MQLNAVRYFVALSDTLNFTKAAEQCNVSQPAFTRAIQKLEEELGGLLVSRERDNSHLTALGLLVEPQLREMIAQAGQAKKLARRFIRLDQADLRVGVMCTIGPIHFVSFLGRFRGRHPGVELTLLEAVPDRLCDMLMDGSLDVAIMARPDGFGPAFHTIELYSERFVVACSAGHRFAGQRNVPIKHLDGEYYFLRINCEFRDTLREICLSQQVHLIHSYRSEREDWILTMVAAGLGVSFLPENSAVFPGVIGCPVVHPAVHRDVCVVTVAGRRHSAPVASFIDAVRRHTWPTGGAEAVSEASERI